MHDIRVLSVVQLTAVTPTANRMSSPATNRTSAAADDCSTDNVVGLILSGAYLNSLRG